MIIRNSKFKQVIPDNFTYKGTKYTKAYYKDEILFAYTDDDYAYQYFTIESLEDGNVITLTIGSGVTSTQMTSFSYSVDNGATWNTTTVDSTTQTINVSLDKGDKVLWKGSGSTTSTEGSLSGSSVFSSTKTFDVYGNIMSLLYNENFFSEKSLANKGIRTFELLFYGASNLVSAKNLSLPATTLNTACYYSMFSGCTSLVNAPLLPAITLTNNCYQSMFQNCTSLIIPPELPATTLNNYCYKNMFNGCTSLAVVPELPALTMTSECYREMFRGCTSLVEALDLPATIAANNCCYAMFMDCTLLVKAPALLITTLATGCYAHMFRNCTSLNYIKCLATNISATDCTTNWVNNVASTGTFVKADGMNDWTIDSVNGIPIGWTVQNYAIDYEQEYFTIESLEDGNVITLTIGSGVTSTQMTSISYSVDNGATWNTTTVDSTTQTINVNLDKGEKVLWKGVGKQLASGFVTNGSSYYSVFDSTKNYAIYGNLASLIDDTNFASITESTGNLSFCGLFYNSSKLIDCDNLVIPFTKYKYGDLSDTFRGTSIVNSPHITVNTVNGNFALMRCFTGCSNLENIENLKLLATNLGYTSVYNSMFSSCTSLATAPELPATTLGQYCYSNMFYGCISLVKAPELLATTLVNSCYREMFSGCTNLNYIKCLANNISATDCTTGWVTNVASTGTFIKADGMNDWTIDSVNGIPIGWTNHSVTDYSKQYFTIESLEDDNSITLAKVGNAPTVTFYYSVDNGSTWAEYATESTKEWVLNTGDKVLLKATADTLSTYYARDYWNIVGTKQHIAYGNIMSLIYGDSFASQTTLKAAHSFASLFKGDTKLVEATNLRLPATTCTSNCYAWMFYDCTSLKATPELPATTLEYGCYIGMFEGCKSLTQAPILPATTLAQNCYFNMFSSCSSLSVAPTLPATNLDYGCYEYMFMGCSALTMAPTLPATTLAPYCYCGMFNSCRSLETIDLPATTLANKCYQYMLTACDRISSIKVYAETSGYQQNFGTSMPSSGTYYVKSNATANIINSCPTGWTISKTL